MAADNNHRNDSKINMSVSSQIKCTIKQDLIKQLLEDSIHNSELKINNDALKLVVEVANCIVIETCMRAANQAKERNSVKVDHEHLQECLPQLMLDFP